jgi:diguanylate cyclase (GGDEF)-like protein
MSDSATDSSSDLEQRFGLLPGSMGTALIGMIGQMPVGLCIQDAESGRYLYVNKHLATMIGLTPAQIVGRDAFAWLDPSQHDALRAAEQFAATCSDSQLQSHTLSLARGAQRRFSIVRRTLAMRDERAARLLCCVWLEHDGAHRLDLQAVQSADAQTFAGVTDSGFPHRRVSEGQALFDEQFGREFDLSNREHREFALVAMKVDPLGTELAKHGDVAAGLVEQRLSALLRGNIRTMDSSFCLAQDRFVLLLSGVGLATAHSRVEALRRQCAGEPINIEGVAHHFSVSIGVASYPHTTRDRGGLLEAAEQAAQQAQRRGGNHVALASIRFEVR